MRAAQLKYVIVTTSRARERIGQGGGQLPARVFAGRASVKDFDHYSQVE
jgi:hypothetical protein